MVQQDPKSDAFALKVIGRETLFRRLMIVGVIVGLGLLFLAIYRATEGRPWSQTAVIAILVLLNARGNLRQVKIARILAAWAPRELLEPKTRDDR